MKCARVVGDVMGKYHPHGDSAIYDAMVRMAQPFSMRYLLVDGQGNFGSVDGDPPAAHALHRSAACRALPRELLADIDKETVDFVANYDGKREGAVGAADARSEPADQRLVRHRGRHGHQHSAAQPDRGGRTPASRCIDDPNVTIAALMQHIPGPDFPTAGIINGAQEIATRYTHRPRPPVVRARTQIEEWTTSGRQAIIVTELPYQVNKARLLERIAELVRDKIIDGIVATVCATSPTRTACASSSSSSAARSPTSC